MFNNMFGIVILVFAIVWIVQAIRHASRQRKSRMELREALAKKFGADLRRYGRNGWQQFDFESNGNRYSVRLSAFQEKFQKKLTKVEVSVAWPDPSARMAIFAENLPGQLKKFLGMEDIVIGSALFDERFVLQGNRSDLIQLLTQNVQQKMLFLLEIEPRQDCRIDLIDGRLTIRKPVIADHLEFNGVLVINRFVEMYSELLEAYSHGSGVTIIDVKTNIRNDSVGPSSAPHASVVDEIGFDEARAVKCLVCGEEIQSERVVHCRTCLTAHHRDCWEYIGSCSIYGCGEKRFKTRLNKVFRKHV